MKFTIGKPLKVFSITQPFGANYNTFYKELGMLGHNGLDLVAPDSTEVYATHDGRVTFTGYDGSGGLGIVIRTEEKFDYYQPKDGKFKPAYFKTIYWHLKKDSIVVTGGDKVKKGQLIALADNTGMSTGSHLHFGLKPMERGEASWAWYNTEHDNGYWGAVDPVDYFEKDMQQVTIERKSDSGVQTLGELQAFGFSCKTLERPWKDNQKNISCIPKGTYKVEWTFSPKLLKYTYEVFNVPNRTGIRLHPGNFFFDVDGCILLGNGFQDLNKDGKLDILNSRVTMQKFEEAMGKKPFELTVK